MVPIKQLDFSVIETKAKKWYDKKDSFSNQLIENEQKKRRRYHMASIKFRFAQKEDVPLILKFIYDLAQYEKLEKEVVATEALLEEWIFEKEKAEVIFVMEEEKEVGFALFFHNFSTFLGRAGIYLEDLYVMPEYRGKGYGKALLKKLAAIAVERGCGRLEWWCLDWNQPSIDFYRSLQAEAMDAWTVYRIAGDTLYKLAETKEDGGIFTK